MALPALSPLLFTLQGFPRLQGVSFQTAQGLSQTWVVRLLPSLRLSLPDPGVGEDQVGARPGALGQKV